MDTKLERRLIDPDRNEYVCTDQKGNSSQYILYEGQKFFSPMIPGDVKERFDAMKNLPCRDDDILMMTLPKSGTHWLTNIVNMVANGNTEYSGTPSCMEYVDLEPVKTMPSPRILHTHVAFPLIPSDIKRSKSKIITIIRNPKDVMTSLYTFIKKLLDETTWFRGNWEGFFKLYMSNEVCFQTWFQHIQMWGSVRKEFPDKQILFLSFEDMKKNLYENVVKIDEFLGFGRSKEFCQQVATRCTFSNMKRDVNKERGVDPRWTIVVKDGILPIYRKGEIGDWKNWFTVAQNEIFDRIYQQEMKDFDMSGIYQAT